MHRILTAAAIAALIPISGAAQAPDPLVVSQDWLAAHLHDANLVLLQVGTEETYKRGHIPGARFADWMNFHTMSSDPKALTLEMPPPEEIRSALEALGISNGSHVVVYASDEYWSPSTRVVLTLDYAGLTNVSYLDGGLQAWTAAAHPVSTEVASATRGTLAPLTIKPIIVDAAFVQAHAKTPGFAIVDARAASFYDGVQVGGQRGGPKKLGHIPGAVSAPFDEFADGDGKLKSPADIKALFDKAGVKPTDTVIGYCHVGQQATAMLFAARTLGHPVLLYDGSFEDWARRDLPVELPAGKK
jgi:thiosulfate/3-mercaptopyruvate sulfurtransferase